jgi:hypothetical protein
VVLAYADGFWLISLRGAVGAVERTDSPFDSWIRESAISVPVFVLAVLAALMVAQRVYGPKPRGGAVLGTALMVAVAGTIAGIVELVVSSAYDYHLQLRTLETMTSMRGCVSGNCMEGLKQASFDLQVRAVGYGSIILLVTNVVVVGWVLAFRGGRLDVTRRQESRSPIGGGTRDWAARTSRVDDLRLLLVVGLVGAAAVHAAVVPEHLDEWTAAGVFFIALTAAELGVAVLVLVRTTTAALLAVVVSVGPLLLWAYSRSAGLPFGPEPGVPEAVGLADCAACALELATLVIAVLLIRRQGWLRRRPPVSDHLAWLVATAVIAVSVLGVAGSTLGWISVTGTHLTMTRSG